MTDVAQKNLVAKRIMSIDALRGLVMLFMLVDHVRETIYLHMQVGDPVDAATVDPVLFYTRLLSAICAPAFVFLTGLSAWLYGQSHSKYETSLFLLKRGLVLMVLEVIVINFAWTAQFPPERFYLQVIWAIGLSMLVLAVIIHLPRIAQAIVAIGIMAGHNLLDEIVLNPEDSFFIPWSMLHQNVIFDIGWGMTAKTTYPILAWIGVIGLGYLYGPLFGKSTNAQYRRKKLIKYGIAMIVSFIVIRIFNFYGDIPWAAQDEWYRTIISFVSLTKYPPSLLFLLPTLGFSLLLMAFSEKIQENSWTIEKLSILGGAPMFFYILHLYVLKVIYLICLGIFGANQGLLFGVDNLFMVWVCALLLILPLYYPSVWFAKLKRRRRDLKWLRYL